MPALRFVAAAPARYLRQRAARAACQHRRVREAVFSLNDLSERGTGSRRDPQHTPSVTPTASQSQVVSCLGRRVAQYPRDPEQRSDREALFALLKTHDFYDNQPHGLESYDPERVKVLRGV
eukprot:598035-Heterocapsa_arctica.AAC.1